MRFSVKAKPRAKHASVVRTGENEFDISVHEAPEDGKANDAVRYALARHLGIAPSRIRLIVGKTARKKVFEVV